MKFDVTDATFATEVVERSMATPVVVDLWAPWCGPCRQLGPILETVVDETDGAVVLAKVNVDENPEVSAQFRVQGIPAVYALKDGAVVDGFVGAQGEAAVREFVARLAPDERDLEIAALLEAGDEASLQAVLDLDPAHEEAICALAELMIGDGRGDVALQMLERVPDSAQRRHLAALARTGGTAPGDDEILVELEALLGVVKDDDEARQRYLDLLEVLGATDPRAVEYRRKLTMRLF